MEGTVVALDAEEATNPVEPRLKLITRVRSYWSLPHGEPKSYLKGRKLPQIYVDMNYGPVQLVDFVAHFYMWGSKQYLTLRRQTDRDDGCFEIKSDEQLLEWFHLNIDKGVACINAQINDFEGPLHCSPTKRRLHPIVRNRAPTNDTDTSKLTTSTNERDTSKSAPKKTVKG